MNLIFNIIIMRVSLIDNLINQGRLKTPEIISAFRKINRRDFVRIDDTDKAEVDSPLSIGFGQTISQPYTVAFMLEKLQPQAGDKILDVGCGSGWTTALLAQIVGRGGRVYGVERIRELYEFASANADKYDFMKKSVVQIFCTDGYGGLPEAAPFDKILASAASEEIPAALLEQLKIGGKLVMPIGREFESQSIVVVEKTAERLFSKKEYPGFVFVPLVKKHL